MKAQEKDSSRLASYDEVVSKASLNDIQLMDLNFNIQPEFFSESSKRKLAYHVEKKASHFDPDAGIAAAFISMEVKGVVGRKKVLSCKALYSIVYDNLLSCDQEAVEAFLRRVAQFTCYPYFRSLFASLDWAAGLRLPPLPVHKEAPRSRKESPKVSSRKPDKKSQAK